MLAPTSAQAESERAAEDPPSERRRRAVDRYRVLEYLDSGGTADVFAALDLVSGDRVALKILNDTAAKDVRLRNYFLNGSRAAQRVEHANLVRVLDVREPEGASPFAAMELVLGRPLSAWLCNDSALDIPMAVEVALQTARGLDAAHAAGVIHCDVKPENLLLESGGAGGFCVKVIDFDLAAFTGEIEENCSLLRGTAKYMAPEQVVGDCVDPRTDVYGLGVVMYRMLTGHLPFDLKLCPTLLFHQLVSPAPPVSWLCDGASSRLDAIVRKTLAKAPDNRYPCMRALIGDLEALSSNAPLLASRPRCEPDAYVPSTDEARAAARMILRAI
jgi:serine/threonine-protein kinase